MALSRGTSEGSEQTSREQAADPQECLGRLNAFSWELNSLHDEEAIMRCALHESPLLVGAESSAVWLWDADQQAPVMVFTSEGPTTDMVLPDSLLCLLRQASSSRCAFSVDSGEGDASWPAEMQGRAVAFIPLSVHQGCLGLLTVHHLADAHFSHEDILLLSSLGNLTATALRNAQLYTNERQLINLLQTSIRQVVRATSGQMDRHEEFVQSLLGVAEGLTKADAVGAVFAVQDRSETVCALSGALARLHRDELRALGEAFRRGLPGESLPQAGLVGAAITDLPLGDELRRRSYVVAPVRIDNEESGIVFALAPIQFSEDQQAFLHTIAEQIGVGIANIQRAADNQWLLVQVANVAYASEEISSTFDPNRIFVTISQAASRALNVPIAFCGWQEDDGTLRIAQDAAVGLEPEVRAKLQVTTNNLTIREVMERRSDVSSRTVRGRQRSPFPNLAGVGVQDWVCVPMVVKQSARGIMFVADTRPREFSRREVALLSTYANQAALAVENSLLYEQVDRQLRQVAQLYEVSHAMSSTLDMAAVYTALLQATTRALEVPAAMICLADSASGMQKPEMVTGIDEAVTRTLRFAPGEGIVGMVARRAAPIASSNLTRDGRDTALRDLARREHLVSSLTVPFLAQGRVFGTLTVFSREAHDFSGVQVQLLQAMTMEASVALENARLFQQERERSVELRALIGEVSRRVSTTLDLVSELLAISRGTEPAEQGQQRTMLRLWGIAAMQTGIDENDPTVVDVKDAVTHVARELCSHAPQAEVLPDIRVTGTRLVLPSRMAMMVAAYITEWLIGVIEHRDGDPDARMVLAFQQLGREVIVDVDDVSERLADYKPANRAIIDAVIHNLGATVTETASDGLHRVRLRFTRPNG